MKAAAPATPPAPKPDASRVVGALFGMTAVVIWGGFLAYARLGVSIGLGPGEFIVLRYVTAGLIMLPFLLRSGLRDLGGVGWGRGAILALVAGPPFIAVSVTGFQFAPLAAGAVVQPAAITLFSLPLAWLVLRAHPTRTQFLAMAIVVAGLALMLVATGVEARPLLLGTGFFATAGGLWALFTVLLRRWRVDGMQATAAVAVLSAAVAGPVYLIWTGPGPLLALAPETLAIQLLVQGLCAGVIAVVAYGRAVVLLGPARAVLFTALVPGAALIIGMPVTGEVPGPLQIAGVVIVMVGLVVSIRPPTGFRVRRARRSPDG
ncbi:MAG: DMT family transporter [Thalassobaculaceae bacterium]|nr:DMT family transporter [Thalassobaculaceae bacterium]